MPILKNAKKALRSSERKREVNQRVRSQVKTQSDKVSKTKSPQTLSGAYSAIDKAVKKNLLSKNKAARMKSKLAHTVA